MPDPAWCRYVMYDAKNLACAVPTSVERPVHESAEEVSAVGIDERRTTLGGHHQAGVDLRPGMKSVRRQPQARGERVPGAPVQGLQCGRSRPRVSKGNRGVAPTPVLDRPPSPSDARNFQGGPG